jgi:hypothetical protein
MDVLLEIFPFDVVCNHILPYTYQPQSHKLLQDIRSYYTDMKLLDNIYLFDFNYVVLFNDLVKFCNSGQIPHYYIGKKFFTILQRNFKLSNCSFGKIQHFVFVVFYIHSHDDLPRKIKFLWGLLTIEERTQFINMYIQDYYDSVE